MLISTEPLQKRHASWARFYACAAVLVATSLVLLHVQLFDDFHRLLKQGKVVWGHVTNMTRYDTRSKKSVTWHYLIRAELPDGRHVRRETNETAYREASVDSPVPFVCAPPSYQIGTSAGISILESLIGLVSLVGGLLIFWYVWMRYHAWYEAKLVERGRGPLPR